MERFDLGYEYGASTSIEFATNVIVQSDGQEQRNITQSIPRIRIQLGNRVLRHYQRSHIEDLFNAVNGREQVFKVRDWTDYSARDELIGVGDGTTKTFQLVKRYKFGSYSVRRPILCPMNVSIASIGTNRVEVDEETGMVTFETAPQSGRSIYASFEFDVPVRFAVDSLPMRYDYENCEDNLYSLDSLEVIEERRSHSPIFDPVSAHLDETFDIGFDYGTVGGDRYSTSVIPVQSGYERRDRNWSQSRGRWNLGNRKLLEWEKDYYISLFRVARGAGCTFNYFAHARKELVRSRFESDAMTVRFDATDGERSLYYFGGIPITETIPLVSA